MSTASLHSGLRKSQTVGEWLSHKWFGIFLTVYGVWVFSPFFAPVFMHIGWDGAGKSLYFMYSFFCHQLPERSFFLFGQKTMYSLSEIQTAWQNTIDPTVLRKFVGNTAMGWKVAWSDRMISFYTSVWFFAVMWPLFGRKIKPLPWWGLTLFLLPMALDGSTHMISDLLGIGQGFRYMNEWLAILTRYSLPTFFYVGDALGSFNSWMRLVTGLLAGLGLAWFAFPYVHASFGQSK